MKSFLLQIVVLLASCQYSVQLAIYIYRYAAQWASESDRRRLRPAGGDAACSGDEVLQVRLLPIHESIANEIEKYLSARATLKLPSSPSTPLIWNATRGGRAYPGTGISYCIKPLLHQCGIKAASGNTPRIHDFRNSLAVNALLRWYRSGADVDAKLPLLATYLGHGPALSTHHYLHFIEPMRGAASERLAKRYGSLVVAPVSKKGRLR